MSNVEQPQGYQVSIEKVLEKLKNKVAEQAVQIAMLETYIDELQSGKTEQVTDVGN